MVLPAWEAFGRPTYPLLKHRRSALLARTVRGNAGFRSPPQEPHPTVLERHRTDLSEPVTLGGPRQHIRGHLFPAAFWSAKGCDPSTII